MKFFLDANIPYSALQVFEELKLEATHARDVGKIDNYPHETPYIREYDAKE